MLLGMIVGILLYNLRHQYTSKRALFLLSTTTFLLTVVAGGLSQTYVTLQTTLIILALLAVYLVPKAAQYRPGVVPLLLTGLVGSLLALLLLVIAPGNVVRQAYFTPTTDVFLLAKRSFSFSISFVYNIPRRARLEIPLVAIIGLLLGLFWHPSLHHMATTIQEYRQSLARKGVFIILCMGIGYLLIMSALVPAIYGISRLPPGRALFIPHFVFFCTLLCTSYIIGLIVQQVYPALQHSRFAQAVIALLVLVLLFASPFRTAHRMYNLRTEAHAYAQVLNE